MFKTIANLFRLQRRWFFTKGDIHVEAAKGHTDNLIELLEKNPDRVNLFDKMDSGTPLHWAAIYGQSGACKIPLAHGADLQAVDDEGATPLHWAISGGELEIVRLLVKRGANLGMRDHDGHTPLEHAEEKKKKEIAAFLRKQRVGGK